MFLTSGRTNTTYMVIDCFLKHCQTDNCFETEHKYFLIQLGEITTISASMKNDKIHPSINTISVKHFIAKNLLFQVYMPGNTSVTMLPNANNRKFANSIQREQLFGKGKKAKYRKKDNNSENGKI